MSHTSFLCVLSLEGKGPIGGREEQLEHRRLVPSRCISSSNHSKIDDVEDYTRRRWTTPMGKLTSQSTIPLKYLNNSLQRKSERYKYY